ncbi:MAG: iron-containing alcohol dehydrogenase [Pseudomonadota bacterium]
MGLSNYLSRIQFDFGAVAVLSGELALLGVKRPLIVTDKGVQSAGLLDRITDQLVKNAYAVYADTPSNPTEQAALAALRVYNGENCDGVIALGGGSPIDLGKAVALLASHGGSLGDYNVQKGGSEKIGAIAPVIAIPTTAGTGAEVGRACVMTLADGTKSDAVSLNLIPRTVICDPELTLGLPPGITAATGMDALSHGIETYVSNQINPPAEGLALDCIRRIAGNIETAYHNGSDRNARWEMLAGALEGGMVLQKGLGAVHALSSPLGELKLHHGTLNAVLMPHVYEFNRDAAREKYQLIARLIGLKNEDGLGTWLQKLNETFGMPVSLGAMGVTSDIVPDMAEKAARTHLSKTNPRAATAENYVTLLNAAL